MNECWIVFEKGDFWTKKYLKKGFGHLLVISKSDVNWYMFNPRIHGMDFQVCKSNPDIDLIESWRKQDVKIVHITYQGECNQSFFSFLKPGTCVNIVKYLTRLKVFALTPYGLYRKLYKMRRSQKYPSHIQEIKFLI